MRSVLFGFQIFYGFKKKKIYVNVCFYNLKIILFLFYFNLISNKFKYIYTIIDKVSYICLKLKRPFIS